VLAFAWGLQFVDGGLSATAQGQITRAGYFVCFLFLVCGSMRLARFNITTNPVPKNPGRADRKYFVGLPIPSAAAMVAAVVYAADGVVIRWWPFAVLWMILLGLLAFLMVCTWRYRSFKDLNLMRPRSPVTLILLAALIYLIWNYDQPVLLGMASAYVASGILVRVGGVLRRRLRSHPTGTPNRIQA
jgi:CDP-diacylglycerol--serine O-phosphatidyltransferase